MKDEQWDQQRAILAPLAGEVRQYIGAIALTVKELEAKGATVEYFFNGKPLDHGPAGNFDFEIRMSITQEPIKL